MKLVEEQADELAAHIVEQIRTRHDFPHYRELSEDVFAERISQILSNVYLRLGNWLSEEKPKNTLFAYYADLGAQRFREGIPLEEVIGLFLLVKREIWHFLREEIAVMGETDLKRLMELDYYVSLFFDRIVSSTVSGYQNELWDFMLKGRLEKHRLEKVKGLQESSSILKG